MRALPMPDILPYAVCPGVLGGDDAGVARFLDAHQGRALQFGAGEVSVTWLCGWTPRLSLSWPKRLDDGADDGCVVLA